jgi:hypothetical protein
MPDGIQSTVRLFADDTIAYVTISSDTDAANLQQDLDKLAEWESKWLMKFHPEKCNVLTISKKRSPRFFFDRFVGDVYVPFKKTDGVVGFRADGAYMFTPFEV